MKKRVFLIMALSSVMGLLVAGCALFFPTNPESEPLVTVTPVEAFALDPDNPDTPQLAAKITITHPVAVKEWSITVQPVRAAGAGGQGGAQGGGGERQARPEGERQARPEGAAAEGGEQRQRPSRGPFFELKGEKTPPHEWKWDGKSTREPRQGQQRAMVQSATDYQLTVTATDQFGNTGTYEGVLSVDVLVRRDGDDYRIIVPSIAFPPSSANFSLLSDEQMRPNRVILRRIATALSKYPDYAVTVEGHSNPTTAPGTAERTREETTELKPLSEARAKAVIDYLVATHSADKAKLTAVGIGGERTVAAWDDADENAANRRVEFILKK